MGAQHRKIVVAGHICLDLIPGISVQKERLEDLLEPGKLVAVGPAVTSTGGAVANTGLALHKLGYPVELMGKVGADAFGDVILRILQRADPDLANGMIVDPAGNSSYTVVISPPGIDRVFLHHPGTNDTWGAPDMGGADLSDAAIFHFGYPPLMRRLYGDGGVELASIMEAAAGAVTSLDMAMPDPDSEAGRVEWLPWLRRVLPHVDIFLPSYDEICFMLRMPRAEPTTERLAAISEQVIAMGAAVVAIKLGDQGLYLRTVNDAEWFEKLANQCNIAIEQWTGRELLVPCYRVQLVGATGAGDTTIAGFLAAFFDGASPESALNFATAVGACACEASDATSGIPDAHTLRHRIARGWERNPVSLDITGWTCTDGTIAWKGPNDTRQNR